jgi:hypothetical protein
MRFAGLAALIFSIFVLVTIPATLMYCPGDKSCVEERVIVPVSEALPVNDWQA